MSAIDIILVIVAALGFLPLGIVLYKKRLVKKIVKNGVLISARIYHIHRSSRSRRDLVYYSFMPLVQLKEFNGILATGVGKHRVGDMLEIYYMPGNPGLNTVKGGWDSWVMLVFVILIAVFVLFAVYQLYWMVHPAGI